MHGQTLVCFAVEQEAAPFRRLAGAQSRTRILVTGMGRANAQRSILASLGVDGSSGGHALTERSRSLSGEPPSLVLTCGFAGGLKPGLTLGTVVYEAEPQLGLDEALQQAGAQRARLHCSARVASTADEKRQLRETTGADAVEMESGAICESCREHGVPAAVIRVILDSAELDLPLDFNSVMTPDLRMDPRKLTLALLKSPSKIAALLRFQKQTRFAASRLAEVLARCLALRANSC